MIHVENLFPLAILAGFMFGLALLMIFDRMDEGKL